MKVPRVCFECPLEAVDYICNSLTPGAQGKEKDIKELFR